jgi:hypothetical protein
MNLLETLNRDVRRPFFHAVGYTLCTAGTILRICYEYRCENDMLLGG